MYVCQKATAILALLNKTERTFSPKLPDTTKMLEMLEICWNK